MELLPRQYCYGYGCNRYRNRNWDSWGRYVVSGLAVLFLMFFLLSCCCLARRRRRRGRKPYRGTGWMAPAGKFGPNAGQPHNGTTNYPPNNNTNAYNNNNNTNNTYPMNSYPDQSGGGHAQHYYNGGGPPPPAYYGSPPPPQQPQYTGTAFNPNDGYYGNQGYDYGVTSPGQTYQRGGADGDSYPPPPAAPGK